MVRGVLLAFEDHFKVSRVTYFFMAKKNSGTLKIYLEHV